MVIPDANLLLYAYNTKADEHEPARQWWEALINGNEAIGIPHSVIVTFLRILTNPKMLSSPESPETVFSIINEWFEYPNVRIAAPGVRHWEIMAQIIGEAGTAGDIVPDAHIAALAMEHQAVVHTHDKKDFRKFIGVRWHDPLSV